MSEQWAQYERFVIGEHERSGAESASKRTVSAQWTHWKWESRTFKELYIRKWFSDIKTWFVISDTEFFKILNKKSIRYKIIIDF